MRMIFALRHRWYYAHSNIRRSNSIDNENWTLPEFVVLFFTFLWKNFCCCLMMVFVCSCPTQRQIIKERWWYTYTLTQAPTLQHMLMLWNSTQHINWYSIPNNGNIFWKEWNCASFSCCFFYPLPRLLKQQIDTCMCARVTCIFLSFVS